MTHLSEREVLYYLVQFTLLFVVARVLADIMKRLGQATVIGELLAGIILGQSLLGHFLPSVHQLLFPPQPIADHLLEATAWTGVIMLLLYTGLETDLGILRKVGRTAIAISWLGMLVPLVTGFALGWKIPATYLAHPHDRLIFSLFIAVAMSISAVPVIAKILIDLDLMRRDLGLMILAAGILDDTMGWLMLSVVAGLAARGIIDLKTLGSIAIAVAAFVGFCYYVGCNLIVRIMRWVDDRAFAEHAGMSTMVGIAMVCAIITQAIGIHAVFGAFIAGVMLGRSTRLRKSDRTELEAITIGVFAPLFFAYSGLKVDLFALHGIGLLCIVLGIAILGKLIGCTAGALLSRLRWREALAVAIGMNARGGMEIVVAIVTSLMTPPCLTWLLSGVEHRPEESERLQREKILARLPFTKEGAKLLVLSGGGPNAQLAAHIAASLGDHPDASITVFRATVEGSETTIQRKSDPLFEHLMANAELAGAHTVYQRFGSATTITEAIVKESERGYDAIFAGASRVEGDYMLGGEVLRELVNQARTPVIIVRNVGAPVPLRRVLVPTTGALFSRLGATIAMLYAGAVGAKITALFVNEIPIVSLRRFRPQRGNDSAQTAPITGEIQAVGQQLGISIEVRAITATKPENAILLAADRENVDLIVMGVQLRPTERGLYFGPKVEHILRNTRCAIAVVVTPESSLRE